MVPRIKKAFLFILPTLATQLFLASITNFTSAATTILPRAEGWNGIGATASYCGLAVGPNGEVVHIGAYNYSTPSFALFQAVGVTAEKQQGSGWTQISGSAKRIVIGPFGMWILNNDSVAGGSNVSFRDTSGNWTRVGGGLTDIAVGSSGQVWGVNNTGTIFFREGISASNPMGTVWTAIDGALTQISSGANDALWGVNTSGQAWTRTSITPNARKGSGWQAVATPELFAHISVGFDESVWGVGRSGKVYYWAHDWASASSGYGDNKTWVEASGISGAKQVIAGRDGEVWVITTSGAVYFKRTRTPLLVPGKKVVLVFYKDMATPKLLKVTDGKYLSPTGTNPDDAACQFSLLNLRHDETYARRWWIGFKSATANNNNLQSIASASGADPAYTVRFENQNFSDVSHTSEHWRVVPVNADGFIMLQNHACGTYMALPDSTGTDWAKNRVWTSYALNAGAGAGVWERIMIMTPDQARQIASAFVPAITTTPAGGTSYTYPQNSTSIGIEFAATTWKLPIAGQGVVKFQVKASSDFSIVVAPSTATTGNLYLVGIGYSNSKAVIRRKLSAADSDNVAFFNLTAAQKLDGTKFVDYWVMVNNGHILMGTGTTAGQNQFLVYNDPSPLSVQYVGFGGYINSAAAYQNIAFENLPIAQRFVNAVAQTMAQGDVHTKITSLQSIINDAQWSSINYAAIKGLNAP